MPKTPDFSQVAHRVFQQATGEAPKVPAPAPKPAKKAAPMGAAKKAAKKG